MAHARAKLTPVGRAALVDRILVQGWPVARAAEAMNVSRATAYKWVRRFQEEGPGGLQDRSSAPRCCPNALPPSQVHRILAARRRTKPEANPGSLQTLLGEGRGLRSVALHRLGGMHGLGGVHPDQADLPGPALPPSGHGVSVGDRGHPGPAPPGRRARLCPQPQGQQGRGPQGQGPL